MVLGSTDADCRHRTSNYGRTHVAAELRSPDNRCSYRNRWIRRISGAIFTAQGTAQSLVDGCRRSRRRHRTVADVRSRILRQFHRLSSGRRHYPVGLMAYFSLAAFKRQIAVPIWLWIVPALLIVAGVSCLVFAIKITVSAIVLITGICLIFSAFNSFGESVNNMRNKQLPTSAKSVGTAEKK